MSEYFDDDADADYYGRQHRRRMKVLHKRAYWTGWANVAAALFVGAVSVSSEGVLAYLGMVVAIVVAVAGGWLTERYRP